MMIILRMAHKTAEAKRPRRGFLRVIHSSAKQISPKQQRLWRLKECDKLEPRNRTAQEKKKIKVKKSVSSNLHIHCILWVFIDISYVMYIILLIFLYLILIKNTCKLEYYLQCILSNLISDLLYYQKIKSKLSHNHSCTNIHQLTININTWRHIMNDFLLYVITKQDETFLIIFVPELAVFFMFPVS